jgi:hypothetical protein
MNDPLRLARSGGEWERALLRSARPRAPRSASQRAVVAATAALATSGAGAGLAAAAPLAKLGPLAGLKVLAILGALSVGVATTAVALHHDRPEVAVAPSSATAPAARLSMAHVAPRASAPSALALSASAPQASESPAEPSPPTSAPAPPRAAAPSSKVAARAGTELPAELAMLKQARGALQAGDAASALSTLDRYHLQFPHGAMAPEAALLRIEALAKAGDHAAARRTADALLASDPESPYAARVRPLLGPQP